MQNLSQAGWIRPSKQRALSAGVIGTLRTPAWLIPRINKKHLNWILINFRKLVPQVARNVIEHWVFYYCSVIPVIISDSIFPTRLLVLKIIKLKKKTDLIVKSQDWTGSMPWFMIFLNVYMSEYLIRILVVKYAWL